MNLEAQIATLQTQLTEARQQAAEAAAMVEKMMESRNRIGIGGNHLASWLILQLGADEQSFPPYETPIDEAYERLSANFDVWLCWKFIMEERECLRSLTPTNALEWYRDQVLEAAAKQADINATEAADIFYSSSTAVQQAQDAWEQSEFWREFAHKVRSMKGTK